MSSPGNFLNTEILSLKFVDPLHAFVAVFASDVASSEKRANLLYNNQHGSDANPKLPNSSYRVLFDNAEPRFHSENDSRPAIADFHLLDTFSGDLVDIAGKYLKILNFRALWT